MFTNKQVIFIAVMVSLMTYLQLGTCLRTAVPIAWHILYLGMWWGMVIFAFFNRKAS